ncbi:MAG TPA: hypothetical protein VII47_12615, partial [Actinomycetota bacterium]
MRRGRAISLAIRLVATYALIVAATLTVVGVLVRQRTDYYLDREIDARLAALVKSFEMGPAGTAQTPDDLSKLSRDWLFEVPLPENSVAAVGTADRERLWTPQAQDLLQSLPKGLELLDYHSDRWRIPGWTGSFERR